MMTASACLEEQLKTSCFCDAKQLERGRLASTGICHDVLENALSFIAMHSLQGPRSIVISKDTT